MRRAITILKESFLKQKPVDNYLKNFFRENKNLGARDRAYISGIVWGVVRNYKRLSTAVGCDAEKMVAEYIKNPVAAEFVPEYSDFLLSVIDRDDLLFMQNNNENRIDIKVNTLKTSTDAVLKDLKMYGPEILSDVQSGIRIAKRVDFNTVKSFRRGMFMVQDKGSQMVAENVRLCGDRVLDYCAGAGGKSLNLAIRMKDRGEITAYDIIPTKLDELRSRAEKMGLTSIFPRYPYDDEEFDTVLADVPCSGSGTFARSPDAKWRIDNEKLAVLIKNGADILNKVKRHVRRGGILAYATCSLIDAENMGQINAFLKINTDFSLIDALTVRPSVYHTDGFFLANLRRNEN